MSSEYDEDDVMIELEDFGLYEELEEYLENQDSLNEFSNLPETELNEEVEDSYERMLENDISQGKITDYNFEYEKLLIRYRHMLKNRKFKLDDESKDKVEKIQELCNTLLKEFSEEKIDEIYYKEKIKKLLNLEIQILLENEDFSLESSKIGSTSLEGLTFEEKMDYFVKKEREAIDKVAKEYGIEKPQKLKIDKKDSNMIKMQKYLRYAAFRDKYEQKCKNFLPGYRYSAQDKDYKIDLPLNTRILRLKEEFSKDSQFKKDKDITISDPEMDFKIKMLRTTLKNFSREELLSCIQSFDVINSMSYIERLRNNTLSVLKFRKYPETYEKLKETLGESAKYYNIPESKLMINFTKQFFEPTGISSDIQLKEIRTFNPVKAVKIGDKEIPINSSEKGFYFLTKISEIKSQKKLKSSSIYSEKGSIVAFSLKPEYFNKKIYESEGILAEKYYNIIKPLPDELYEELLEKEKNKRTNNSHNNELELTKVYELHIPVKEFKGQKLARRYTEFNDYLMDLLLILQENMLNLESNGNLRSADILYTRIQKIKEYLSTGEDPEFKITGNYTNKFLIENNSEILLQRENGLQLLKETILEYYPDANEFVDKIEEDIFKFDNKNYVDNIKKFKFIITEYDKYLEQLIYGNISVNILLTLEVPREIPEDDLEKFINNEDKLKYLKSWNPEIDNYLKYKDELIVDESITNFKKNHSELSSIEIEKIYEEMYDYKNWQKSLIKLTTLEIPAKLNKTLYGIKYLKSQRNLLICRTIFKPCKIIDRVNLRNSIKKLINSCDLIKIKDSEFIEILSNTIENIIFSLSIDYKKYEKYSLLVKDSFQKMCSLMSEYLIDDETLAIEIQDEKNLLTVMPSIIEFFIKEGDLSIINIERIDKLVILDDVPKLVKEYTKLLRLEELESYHSALIEAQNLNVTNYKQKLIDAISIIIKEIKDKKRVQMYLIANNTYIPPILSNIIPSFKIGNSTTNINYYTPKYIIIGENEYLYGGNYPTFYSTINNERNYTNDDIFNLAMLLNIDYEEDKDIDFTIEENIHQLYRKCMYKISVLTSNEKVKKYSSETIPEYTTIKTKYLETITYLNYIYRPRIGVKEPGEVYKVHKDLIAVSYAVPFKYSPNGLPVYSSKFEDPEFKKYHYIEGPAIFEETDSTNVIYSDMYILIEYLDEYGKVIYFREGVNPKFVKKASEKNFDPCKRFKNQINCDDVNSYGFNRLKCKYDLQNSICKSEKEQVFEVSKQEEYEKKILDELPNDLEQVNFKNIKGNIDYIKTKLWLEAVKKAKTYINQLILINKFSQDKIIEIAKEQKVRLSKYYIVLTQRQTEKKNLEKILEEPKSTTYSSYYNVHIDIPDNLKPQIGELKIEDADYKIITVPKRVYSYKALSIRQLIKGSEYLLPDETIDYFVEKVIEDGKTYLVFANIKLLASENQIRQHYKTETIVNVFYKILSENYDLLYNPPSTFYYNLLKTEFIINKTNVETDTQLSKVNKIPLEMLYSEVIKRDSKDEFIIRDDIYNTMGEVAFNVYRQNNNDTLDCLESFPAEKIAKIQAIKYSVDLTILSGQKIGTINLQDVINEYNKLFPVIKTVLNHIILQLEYGIEHNDKKLLEKYIKKGTKKMEDPNLSSEQKEQLNNIIAKAQEQVTYIEEVIEKTMKKTKKQLEEEEREKIKELKEETKLENEKKLKEKTAISYVISRRRKK